MVLKYLIVFAIGFSGGFFAFDIGPKFEQTYRQSEYLKHCFSLTATAADSYSQLKELGDEDYVCHIIKEGKTITTYSKTDLNNFIGGDK